MKQPADTLDSVGILIPETVPFIVRRYRMIKIFSVVAGLAAAFMVVSVFSTVDAGEYAEGRTLVQASCTSCHNLKRVQSKIGKRDAGAWNDYVIRMQGKGAKVTDSEREIIVKFLSSLESGKDL